MTVSGAVPRGAGQDRRVTGRSRSSGGARCSGGRGVAVVVGLLVAAGRIGALQAQNLDEASAAALEQSFTLRAERARQDGAEHRLRGAVDAFMPTVTFTADRPIDSRIRYSPNEEPTRVGLDTVPRKDPTIVGITANLPLFDGLKRWHTLQSTRTLAEAGRFLLIGKRQQVLLDTAAAYIAVLRDTRIVGYRESQVTAIRRIRDVTEKQFEVNDATRTDVALTRSRVLEAEASRDRALADLGASRREFTRLTRMEPERMIPPRFPDRIPNDEAAYADLVRAANPGIASGYLDAKAADYQAKAIVGELLPTVNLQFSKFAQYGYSPALDRIDDTTTRVLARVPIYEPGTFPRIGEASALARQRGYEAQDNELSTLTAARTAFVRRKAIGDQLARLTARVGELRETMKGYGIERGAGFRTILDELNIRAELADAEVAAAIVLTERDGASLQLAAAANLLDVGTSVTAARRFEAILSAPTEPRIALRKTVGPERDVVAASPIPTPPKARLVGAEPALRGSVTREARGTDARVPPLRVSQAN